MIQHRIARTSTERVGVRVVAAGWDGTPLDPSAYPVALAAVPVVQADELVAPDPPVPPAADDVRWRTGEWGGRQPEWYATALFGPDSPLGALEPGRYHAWVRVTALPETLILLCSFLLVVT